MREFLKTFCFSLGVMLGSGIFFLPYTLSFLGKSNSLLGLIFVSFIFILFSIFLMRIGNLFKYIEKNLGQNWVFFISWFYWFISWSSTILIINEIIFYLGALFPIVMEYTLIIKSMILTLFIFLNFLGIQKILTIEIFLTFLKLILLIFIPVFCFLKFPLPNLLLDKSINFSFFKSIVPASWGFVGIECASNIKENLSNKEKIAVISAVTVVSIIYIINTFLVFSFSQGAMTPTPFVALCSQIFGSWGEIIIVIAVLLVCLGSLNAWVVASTYCAVENAQNKYFPRIFEKKNKEGIPYISLILSNIFLFPMFLLGTSLTKFVDAASIGFLFFYFLLSVIYGVKEKSIVGGIFSLIFFILCLQKSILIILIIIILGIPVFFLKKKGF